ncbi:alpha/beta hydrolase [Jatrophihabitans telluris]|uniref:Alpha/beta hydrolase n=1 Tax=Jatrophihabitans telluris TaxID=2038343 RepID=A0ABY4QZJ5_9ACTN|nr:alpha/beta hydrolase [Jatrophihabitans telluris]UQX88900.1 alpha/beta hydrolase [Jatrophihabitans telluris]
MTEPIIDADIANWLIRTQPNGEPTSIGEARQRSRNENALALEHMTQRLVPATEVDDEIDGPAGPLPIRVLRPSEGQQGPLPTVVYFHGGGWVVGDIDTHLGHARRICTQFGAVVVTVGYRLAPEDRFPAAFDDAVAATEWADTHRSELGGGPELILAGDSAGGQLAASTAIARRDAGQPLTAQLLLYPVTDVAGRYAADPVNAFYMSRQTTGSNFGLTLEGMADFAHNYVTDAESTDWRVSPMRAKDLTGVAPAVIHTATLDVLRTEGNFYAHALQRSGVRVITREWPTLNHSYFGLGGVSAVADGAAAQAADDLRDLLAGGGSTEAPPERTLPSYP